jgi:hypothetical protein
VGIGRERDNEDMLGRCTAPGQDAARLTSSGSRAMFTATSGARADRVAA